MQTDSMTNRFRRSFVLLLSVFTAMGLSGCGGQYSLNTAALGIECESRDDCMRRAGLPGSATGNPVFVVPLYPVMMQPLLKTDGKPDLNEFYGDVDLIFMKAIREAFPAAGIVNGDSAQDGQIFVDIEKVNIQGIVYALKCETEYKLEYRGEMRDYLATNTIGYMMRFVTGIPKACYPLKTEIGRQMRKFVSQVVLKFGSPAKKMD